MISKVRTICFSGIQVVDVDVEVHFAKGQPGITIVGLGDKAVKESIDRIRASLFTLGFILPPQRITINLAPADIVKEGTHYDLPIILGILTAMGVLKQEFVAPYIVVGELGLDGSIRAVNGVLPASLHANSKKFGIICPESNGKECAWGGDEVAILATNSLRSLIRALKGDIKLERPEITKDDFLTSYKKDFRDVKGQHLAKFGLEIAASGGHNILLIGAPGTGKSMLAERIVTILPPLDVEEMIEVSMIHSVSGLIKDGKLSSIRPFRSPHSTISQYALIGGGAKAKPGEITLAHNGVLFLDELPEFQRVALEALRQPMETGVVSITRTNAKVIYPANFQLVAAMNPCRCGFYGSSKSVCRCSKRSVVQYQNRVSGPLLDRIDMHVKMEENNYGFKETVSNADEESSASIKQRVMKARIVQKERYKNESFKTNSTCQDGEALKEYCLPKNAEALNAIEQVASKLAISMRGINKIVRVARTIADIEGQKDVSKDHVLKSALFRQQILHL